MSSKLLARLSLADVERGLANLHAKYPNAVARAINRAADSGRVAMTRAVAKDTGLAQKNVKPEIQIARATAWKPAAQIWVSGRRLPLIAFKARGPEPSRGRGRGVSYRLPGGQKKNAHAFLATMRSGHRGVFKRVPGANRRGPKPNRSQLPITELHGPSLPHVFEKHMDAGKKRAQEALVKNLQSEIRFALKR